MENNNFNQPKTGRFWSLCATAIGSALVGVLIACLIMPVFLKGYLGEGGANSSSSGNQQNTISVEKYENPAVAVAETCTQSVVYVESTTLSGLNRFSGHEQVSSSGSGVIISEDGYIVTNNHVIEGAKSIYVTLNDSTRIEATLVGADSSSDLAVLKIEKTGLTPAKFGSSADLRVGEMSIAIGNPFGSRLGNSQTVGYISALNRSINMDGFTIAYIQTDAAINPGNSGGGLFNAKGELIGINTLKSRISGYDQYGNSISSEGIGFSIPIDYVQSVISDLKEHGKVSRPGIGVVIYTATVEDASHVVVDEVIEDSPADKAGVRAQDIVLKVDGKEVEENSVFLALIQKKKIGDKVKLTILRDSQEQEIEVTVGDMSEIDY